MLPAAHRLTDATCYRETTRRGRRGAARTVVAHLRRPAAAPDGFVAPPRVGFVVSRAVGNAVVRNRVRRRLRHLMGSRLTTLPVGAALVVRALPASAVADYAELGADLDRCLLRCLETPASSEVRP